MIHEIKFHWSRCIFLY